MCNWRRLRLACVAFAAFTVLHASAVTGQNAGTADPRLSDPAFVKLRDEALASAKCVGRTNPVAVTTPKPRYPDALSQDRVSGLAITEGIILADGHVAYTRVVRADRAEFGQAALEVLDRYRYKPAMCSGTAVPSFVTITQSFSVR